MSRERRILDYFVPYVVWQNKTLDKMTDQDCIDCIKFIQYNTGTYYVDPMGVYYGNRT